MSNYTPNPISELFIKLNYELFENDPDEYYNKLYYLGELSKYRKDIRERLKYKVNDKSEYDTWYSTPIFWVIYAVGEKINQNNYPKSFTCKMNGLSNKLAKNLFNLLIYCGADLNIKDYYDENIFKLILNYDDDDNRITHRNNNKIFLDFVISKYYNNTSEKLQNFKKYK